MDIGWERDHLWHYLLALGFDPEAGNSVMVLEKNMFDNPNSSAFHVIALFLFEKLDRSRAAVFRERFILLGNFTDPEFRKQCCIWLKEIANEDQNYLPQVTPSSFISPGRKCIQLLYWLARHVVVEDMKRNPIGTGITFAEAVNLRPNDLYMANARCRVAYNKLLQIFQKEDFIIQEYKKKEQLLVKEINQIKSEYADLQVQFYKMKQNDQNENDKTEKIQKVRSIWTLIMEMLISLKKEKEVVDSVLDDFIGQCTLDGTNIVFSVPRLLAHRIESNIHQLCLGNVYEDGKLNFLTVIQLLNEALRTLRDEHCHCDLKQLQVIEKRIVPHDKVLQHLAAKRLKMEQQHCVSTSRSISRKQEDWEVRWKSFLGLCPFDLIQDQDPVLGLLRPSPPHSFNLEEENEGSDFCQHLVPVSDVRDCIHEVHYEKDDGALETMVDKSASPPRWISSVPLESSNASENRDVLIEKNLNIETYMSKKVPMPLNILKNGEDECAISEMCKNTGHHVVQTEPPVRKEDPLMKARDELAEEVAKTVISESPQSGEGRGMALEDLISSLAFNPFLTRKQIPRTPENLLTEIRSSWRKAIQAEDSSDRELAPTKVMLEEVTTNAGPIMQKASDSTVMISTPAFAVPDFDLPSSELKSQLIFTDFRPQEQMKISHSIESPILKIPGMQESEKTEEQELRCIVLKKSSVEDPEEQTSQYVTKGMNIQDICSENNSKTNVLRSDHFQGSLMNGVLHGKLLPLLSSINCEAAHLGILDETLPEDLDDIDPNKSATSETDFGVIDSTYVTDGSKNNGNIQKSKLDLQSPFNTHKVLKKTASRSEEELHQTRNGDESLSCRSDLSLGPENKERDELFGPLELFQLDEEFAKTPSPVSLYERKYSLSSLLVSCQHLEEMSSTIHEIPLGLTDKLKDKEQLNEKPGTKEPSSG